VVGDGVVTDTSIRASDMQAQPLQYMCCGFEAEILAVVLLKFGFAG
jgi:hypothetical protein